MALQRMEMEFPSCMFIEVNQKRQEFSCFILSRSNKVLARVLHDALYLKWKPVYRRLPIARYHTNVDSTNMALIR